MEGFIILDIEQQSLANTGFSQKDIFFPLYVLYLTIISFREFVAFHHII